LPYNQSSIDYTAAYVLSEAVSLKKYCCSPKIKNFTLATPLALNLKLAAVKVFS